MSESKHTPEPWKTEIVCDLPPNNCSVTIIANDNSAIATVQKWFYGEQGPCEETKANARLIATAPELLEATHDAIWALDGIERWLEERDYQTGEAFTRIQISRKKCKTVIDRAERGE